MRQRFRQAPVVVAIEYACPKCGTKAQAHYENADRCYGDLPRCARGCDVPYAVMDAIASWLDERVMNGAGEPVRPTAADLCGYTEARR
jgi:hypothetical protein